MTKNPTKSDAAEPVQTFHLPVNFLHVEEPWKVGRATFYPKDRLLPFIDRLGRESSGRRKKGLSGYMAAMRREGAKVHWATARVRAQSLEQAVERARDSIALARFFQRHQAGPWDVDQQTFGLPIDLASVSENYFRSGPTTASGFGWRRVGNIAEWTFTRAMIRDIRSDPVFQLLNASLRRRPNDRGDLEGRAVTAVRFLNLANVMLAPPIRVVLIAVALEALLGDERRGDRAHRVARRAAYLVCGTGITSESPHRDRPGCFYLASRTSDEVEREMKHLADAGTSNVCTWYLNLRNITVLRNEVLHERREAFKPRTPGTFVDRVDEVIHAVVRWALSSGSNQLSDLDEEIETYLVRAGIKDWQTQQIRPYGQR